VERRLSKKDLMEFFGIDRAIVKGMIYY